MPSVFAGLEDAVSDSVDSVFGDQWDWRPMRAGDVNAPPQVDPDRAPIIGLVAIFDDRHVDASAILPNRGLGGVSKASAQVSSTEPKLSIDVRALLGRRVMSGDHWRRRDTGHVYQVSDVRPDGMGRIVCRLRAIATGPASP